VTAGPAAGEAWRIRGDTLASRLALSEPVAPEVLINIANDPNEGVNLWIARSDPDAVENLLRQLSRLPSPPDEDQEVLLARVDEVLDDLEAVAAITADDATIRRREQACLQCPRLKATTSQLKALFASHDAAAPPGAKVHDLMCGACRCQLGRKVRWLTQGCPLAHPSRPGLTRWDEPIRTGGAADQGPAMQQA
jgi:hypothetical protein